MAKGTQSVRKTKMKDFSKKSNMINKQTKTSAFSRAKNSDNPYRPDKDKGKGNMRSRATINLLKMYKSKPDWDNRRKVNTDPKAGKIVPDRKWYGNTRQLDQKELHKYMSALENQATKKGSGHSILIKGRKLPIGLLQGKDLKNSGTVKLLDIESFKDTFGANSKRKRPNIAGAQSLESMIENCQKKQDEYDETKDTDHLKTIVITERDGAMDKRLQAGQSKRIWAELYKVLDSSDVVVQVIDARDPMGTRTKHVEDHLKKNCPGKHLILILNKCDLVPTSMTQRWVKILSKEYPTLAFKASIENPFGKGSLIQLLRQFDNFHKDKQNISVGFIGYPNVGKSSIINTLRKKAVCKVAPVPGETKVSIKFRALVYKAKSSFCSFSLIFIGLAVYLFDEEDQPH